MAASPNEVLPVTSPYQLLGHPRDLQGHMDALGPLPVPRLVNREWRARVAGLLEESGLAGRGGAAFPAAIKLAVARSAGRGGMVVVNGMEGEPASDKDKMLLIIAPHLVLDGAEILAAACAADEVVICVPDGRDQVATAVTHAIGERQARGIGAVPLRLVRPPDHFVAGEESALAGWIDSGSSRPSFRPDKGSPLRIGKRSALVHNTETLAHVGMIARRGPDGFRSRGLPEEPGTTLITITGSVERPGVVEVDRGTPLMRVVERATPNGLPQALLVGGYGGAWVGPEHFEVPYASLPLRTIGATAGVGVIVALGPDCCGITETARIARYMAGQSAGQCGPCVYGLPAVADDLARLARGTADPELMTRLARRLSEINGRGACRHPDGVVTMVRSALSVFRHDVAAHERGAPCASSSRPSPLRFPGAAS